MLLLPCLMMYYIFLFCFCFLSGVPAWRLMLVHSITVGFSPVASMLLPSGNPFKCHGEVLYLQPTIPPKRFDIFPSDWGMFRRSRPFIFFFEQLHLVQQLTLIFLLSYVILNAIFKNQLLHRVERLPVQRRCSIHQVAAILE